MSIQDIFENKEMPRKCRAVAYFLGKLTLGNNPQAAMHPKVARPVHSAKTLMTHGRRAQLSGGLFLKRHPFVLGHGQRLLPLDQGL